MCIPRCPMILVFAFLLVLHYSAAVQCPDSHCSSSIRATLQDRVNSLAQAKFTSAQPRGHKLTTFAQSMALLLKETNPNHTDRQFHTSTNQQGSPTNKARTDSKENKILMGGQPKGGGKDVNEFPYFAAPASPAAPKMLKTADRVSPLLVLLGSSAASTKGMVIGTFLAKLIKKYMGDKPSTGSTFSRRTMRIGRRSGRSFLDSEAIILFILGLGIGSMMGLGSVLLPLGLYGGYGIYGPQTIPVNTQVTGRRRRDLGTRGWTAPTEEDVQRIGRLLAKAIERYSI